MDSDIKIALRGKSPIDLLSKLPLKYHFYADVFLVSESEKLSPHQNYDHIINLDSGTKLDYGTLYRI